MIFSFDKSTFLEGGGGCQKKNPKMIRGASKQRKEEIRKSL